MLNPFPIQFLAPLAYLILRVCVGIILIRLGRRHVHDRSKLVPSLTFKYFPFGSFLAWMLAITEVILGCMFIVGLYTQIAAIALFVLSLCFMAGHKRFMHPIIPHRIFYLLLSAVSVSLFITGAGGLAFDLPI